MHQSLRGSLSGHEVLFRNRVQVLHSNPIKFVGNSTYLIESFHGLDEFILINALFNLLKLFKEGSQNLHNLDSQPGKVDLFRGDL